MLTTLPDLKRLHHAFSAIEKDAVQRVFSGPTWRRWRYDELAALYGQESDWRPQGCVRSALIGGPGRQWLRQHHRLWWTTDERKAGILFTAHPLTGVEWDRHRIAVRAARDAEYLSSTSIAAAEMQPTYRPHFLAIERHASKLQREAEAVLGMHAPLVARAHADARGAR